MSSAVAVSGGGQLAVACAEIEAPAATSNAPSVSEWRARGCDGGPRYRVLCMDPPEEACGRSLPESGPRRCYAGSAMSEERRARPDSPTMRASWGPIEEPDSGTTDTEQTLAVPATLTA